MCILFEEVTPPDASTCGATEFFDHASARCLPCHPGCETCSGPRNSDCIGRCKYAQDSRGACASLEQQQYAGKSPSPCMPEMMNGTYQFVPCKEQHSSHMVSSWRAAATHKPNCKSSDCVAGQTSWTETTIGHASRKATLAEVI
eukprot:159015-Amphidinium_carterae.1